MVLAMTTVGSAIPTLKKSEDQKKCLKAVVLPDLRLYSAAFPAFHTLFFKSVVYQKLQSEFLKCPNLHFVLFFFEEPDSRT